MADESRGNIYVRLALKGADDIRKRINGIRETAAKARESFQNMVSAPGAKFSEDLGRLRTGVADTVGRLARLGTVATAAFGGTGAALFTLANSAAENAKSVQRQAEITGLTLDRLQKMAYAAKKQAGVDFDEFAELYRDFSVRVGEARAGETMPLESFGRIGLTPEEINSGKTTIELFERYMELLRQQRNQPLVNFAVDELLSDAGSKALPFLRSTREELDALYSQAERNGALIDTADIEAASAYSKSLGRFTDVLERLRKQAGNALLPTFENLFNRVSTLVDENRDATTSFIADAGFRLYGIVEDIFRLADGEQPITSFMQTLVREFRNARDAAEAIGAAVSGAWTKIIKPVYEAVQEAIRVLTDGINRVFGTDLTPQEVGVVLILTKVLGLVGILVPMFALLANPITATVAGIAALTAGIIVFWEELETGVKYLSGLWQSFFQAIFDGVEAVAQGFAEEIGGVIFQLMRGFDVIGELVSEGYERFVAGALEIGEAFERGFSDIVGTWGDAIGWLLDKLGPVGDFIRDVGRDIADLLGLTEETAQKAAKTSVRVGIDDRALAVPTARAPNYAGPSSSAAPTKNLRLVLGGEEFAVNADDRTISNLERYLNKTGMARASASPDWNR